MKTNALIQRTKKIHNFTYFWGVGLAILNLILLGCILFGYFYNLTLPLISSLLVATAFSGNIFLGLVMLINFCLNTKEETYEEEIEIIKK